MLRTSFFASSDSCIGWLAVAPHHCVTLSQTFYGTEWIFWSARACYCACWKPLGELRMAASPTHPIPQSTRLDGIKGALRLEGWSTSSPFSGSFLKNAKHTMQSKWHSRLYIFDCFFIVLILWAVQGSSTGQLSDGILTWLWTVNSVHFWWPPAGWALNRNSVHFYFVACLLGCEQGFCLLIFYGMFTGLWTEILSAVIWWHGNLVVIRDSVHCYLVVGELWIVVVCFSLVGI